MDLIENLLKDKIFWISAGGTLVVVAVAGAIAIASSSDSTDYASLVTKTPSPTVEPTPKPTPCLIKGNISFNTGEKIYHLPGMEFYDETVIESEKGEKLFCTEQQAVKEGWRKAKPAPPPQVQQGYYEEGCEDFETFEQAYDAGYECNDLPSEDNIEDEEGYENYEY